MFLEESFNQVGLVIRTEAERRERRREQTPFGFPLGAETAFAHLCFYSTDVMMYDTK